MNNTNSLNNISTIDVEISQHMANSTVLHSSDEYSQSINIPVQSNNHTPILSRIHAANNICSICLSELVYNNSISDTLVLTSNSINLLTLTECNHIFHKECLGNWKKINPTCPICRKSLVNMLFKQIYAVLLIISYMLSVAAFYMLAAIVIIFDNPIECKSLAVLDVLITIFIIFINILYLYDDYRYITIVQILFNILRSLILFAQFSLFLIFVYYIFLQVNVYTLMLILVNLIMYTIYLYKTYRTSFSLESVLYEL